LHDVGKIHEIYAPILRKPDKLTSEEWVIMKTHPIKSAELVSTVSQLRDLVDPVRHHHENWDGSGYPNGLAGEAIPLWARIITIADTIDAMMTDRPYRKALTVDLVRIELASMAGRQFDPNLCVALLRGRFFSDLSAKLGDGVRQSAPLAIAQPRSRAKAQGA
jgi:HD-GYP domain-containing protein (c-di-GMP phosphodiesterase class II)